MSRADLLSLSADAVAALSNLGLVKRALREIEAGQGPALEESPAGAVTGRFPDGVVATLLPGVALRDADCSCGAVGACRHRVGVALAYRVWAAGQHASPLAGQGQADWSPGGISDEALSSALGRRVLARAAALRRLGADAEVRRGTAVRPPEARLPTSTVRFLVPHDLAYVRCDCAEEQGCEHVALAVWAFREADRWQPELGTATVHLAAAAAEPAHEALGEALSFGRLVLLEGVANLPSGVATRLARARGGLEAEGMVWPATLLDDLEEALEAHARRSARYTPGLPGRLLAELAARGRAVRQGGELPPRYVLGVGESRETPLGHTRLVGLGALVEGSGSERWAQVFLADPQAGVVLVLSKEWRPGPGQGAEDGPRLAERSVTTGVRLRELAAGNVVTRAARRGANRGLRLAASRRGLISVTPGTGRWGDLPEGLLVADLDVHAKALRQWPPRFLRPRVLAETVHVVAIAALRELAYAPGEQALTAVVVTPAGQPLRLVRRHRSVAPHALEVLATTLGDSDQPPRFVSGQLHATAEGLEMMPIAVVTQGVHVLDLDEVARAPKMPLGQARLDTSPLHTALQEGWDCLAEAAHTGLLRSPTGWLQRTEGSALRLEQIGLVAGASRLRSLVGAARGATLAAAADAPEALRAAEAWERAALWLALTSEAL